MTGPAYVCPACGRRAPSPAALCSGGFLDNDHPPNVQPVPAQPFAEDDKR